MTHRYDGQHTERTIFSDLPHLVEVTEDTTNIIKLLSNVPTSKSDPDIGLTAEGLVCLYSNEWKVEGSFKTPLIQRNHLETGLLISLHAMFPA